MTIAHAFSLKTLSPRLRTIIFVSLTLTLYVLVRIDTKYVEFYHAQLLNKRNRPLSGEYEIFLALFFLVTVTQGKLRKLSIAFTNWQDRAKLGEKH